MAIELQEVTSSLISAIGFDDETQELIIEFPKGGRYAYAQKEDGKLDPVPIKHFSNLQLLSQQGESVGKYFLAHVKSAKDLTFRRVEVQNGSDAATTA